MRGVTLRKGVRGDVVRYCVMIKGQRVRRNAALPASLLVGRNGKPTTLLKQDYAKFVAQVCARQPGALGASGRRVPSCRELLKAYEEMAWKRHWNPDYRRPAATTIDLVVTNFKRCVETSGLSWDTSYETLMDSDTVRRIFNAFREKGISGLTAFTYVCSMKSVTAKWTIVEYRDRGYEVSSPILPDFGRARDAPCYRRLEPEMVKRIEAWYAGLASGAADEYLGATIIYQLAVRPNDIGRLTAENFPVGENGRRRLVYKPAKTAQSSNRRVDIEIPDALWEQIRALAGERLDAGKPLLEHWRRTFNKINASMRKACGMEGWTKASYELRKLCIDGTMRRQGADQAVRLSGDRRETLEKYYMDPYKSDIPLGLTAPLGRIGGGGTAAQSAARQDCKADVVGGAAAQSAAWQDCKADWVGGVAPDGAGAARLEAGAGEGQDA